MGDDMLSGCVKEEKTVKRAVFAWNGVETEDRVILDKYQIDTIFMDINHYSSISNYNIFVLAGDPSWRANDMQKVVDDAEEKRADGVIFDIEGDSLSKKCVRIMTGNNKKLGHLLKWQQDVS
mgnify:CR=1 FL=1